MDPNLVPFTITGPVHTPPIAGYDAPDGDYVDVSKNWHEMPKFGWYLAEDKKNHS